MKEINNKEREWAAPESEEDGFTRCTLDDSRTNIPHHLISSHLFETTYIVEK